MIYTYNSFYIQILQELTHLPIKGNFQICRHFAIINQESVLYLTTLQLYWHQLTGLGSVMRSGHDVMKISLCTAMVLLSYVILSYFTYRYIYIS